MTDQSPDTKKLKRVGLALIIIPTLNLAIGLLVLGLILGALYFAPDLIPSDLLNTSEVIQSTDTVATLMEADKEFLTTEFPTLAIAVTISSLIYCAIVFFVVRIGLAWRRKDVFAATTISSLHWIGVTYLISTVSGLGISIFGPLSLAHDVLIYSAMFDLLLVGSTASGIDSLSTGLLFIALSWVLKHGKLLKEENELTV